MQAADSPPRRQASFRNAGAYDHDHAAHNGVVGAAEGDEPHVFRPSGISYLRVPASEPRRSAAFYEAVFGWTVDTERDDPSFEDGTGHVTCSTPRLKLEPTGVTTHRRPAQVAFDLPAYADLPISGLVKGLAVTALAYASLEAPLR
jgi:Glyoxalase/Bleomycin resistance protein/Dioxygenase superfamily